jgi:hypothetical protein
MYEDYMEERRAMQSYADTAERIGIPRGLIEPSHDNLNAEAAGFILSLAFSGETQERIQALLKKNREEKLTLEEQEELDPYLKADNHLSISPSRMPWPRPISWRVRSARARRRPRTSRKYSGAARFPPVSPSASR